MHRLTITPAALTDAEAISALILELSAPFYDSPTREGSEPFVASVGAQATRRNLSAGNFSYRVARAGGVLAGVVALRDNAHLFHLFVAEPFQGQGLARRLWSLVEAEARKAGNPGLFTVNASLNAVPVYERFGFMRDGEVQHMHGISFQPMRLGPGRNITPHSDADAEPAPEN
ncbi:MAG TPA: GNAT family N-acetyltransferase [Rhizobacter sp.]|nr:GNAT family N-acetyltransferase [Rhizobacter sp.]